MTAEPNQLQTGHSRAVITLAMGRPVYLELACNLARSFLHWNRDNGITFHIFSDLDFIPPPDLHDVKIQQVGEKKLGTGFSTKLWLDALAPAEQTLFVDSDCICFGSLAPVFDRFKGKSVCVIGEARKEGEFFGDIAKMRQDLNLPWVPVFVGAIYYLEKGSVSKSVFEFARSLEKQYDALKLVRLRGSPNDEPLIGLAMARHELSPLPDTGEIKADAMHYQTFSKIDVLSGQVSVTNPVPGKPVPPSANPAIFHFNCHFTESRQYRRECSRLEKVTRHRWPRWLATAFAFFRHDVPLVFWEKARQALRPLFHAIFGPRRIATQARES